jgi:V/A-type H+-transporting ATPase subunit E
MAFEDIVKKIQEDAQAEADSLLSLAQAEADAIQGKARKESEELCSQLTEKAKEQAKEHGRRIETLAALELRKEILREKKNLIDDVFARAEEAIITRSPDDYRAFLKPIILAAVESGNEEIVSSDRHRSLFTDDFLNEINAELGPQRGRLRLSAEEGAFSGGFILREGKKETNLTLKTLFQSRRDELEPKVADILFGKDRHHG